MTARLLIKAKSKPVLVVSRTGLPESKLVYLACANKKLRYKHGRSRIIYIGTTKIGVNRIATSAAAKASTFLSMHGVRSLELFVVTCRARQRVKTWLKLERALLLAFKEEFGEVPKGNKQGKNAHWKDELEYFMHSRLRKVIADYSGIVTRSRTRKAKKRKRKTGG